MGFREYLAEAKKWKREKDMVTTVSKGPNRGMPRQVYKWVLKTSTSIWEVYESRDYLDRKNFKAIEMDKKGNVLRNISPSMGYKTMNQAKNAVERHLK